MCPTAYWTTSDVATPAGGIETELTARIVHTVETTLQTVQIELHISLSSDWIGVLQGLAAGVGEAGRSSPAGSEIVDVVGWICPVEAELASRQSQAVDSSTHAVGAELEHGGPLVEGGTTSVVGAGWRGDADTTACEAWAGEVHWLTATCGDDFLVDTAEGVDGCQETGRFLRAVHHCTGSRCRAETRAAVGDEAGREGLGGCEFSR